MYFRLWFYGDFSLSGSGRLGGSSILSDSDSVACWWQEAEKEPDQNQEGLCLQRPAPGDHLQHPGSLPKGPTTSPNSATRDQVLKHKPMGTFHV